MADVNTPNLGLVKPQVKGSRDTWGEKTNDNWDDVDALFKADGTGTAVGVHIGAGKTLRIDGTIVGAGKIATAAIADKAVTYPKIQDVAQNRLLGRTTGAGTVEEIVCTPAGRDLLDDANAAAMRVTLGAASLGANVFTEDQLIQSVNAGGVQGPTLFLDRASPSPANSDVLGGFEFTGRNDAATPEQVVFAALRAILQSVTDGAESGALAIRTPQAGVTATRITAALGLVVGNPLVLADMGVGTVNALAYYQSGQRIGALRGYIDGLILNNSGTSDFVVIGAGQATADDNVTAMSLAATMNKHLTAWSLGTPGGSLDTGAVANNTWYHVFLIRRSDTGVVDVLTSLSATAPTLPAGYDAKRRIGSVKTDGSGNVTPFEQLGDDFEWDTPVIDLDDTTPLTSAENRTLTVPPGVRVQARITPCQQGGGVNATNFSALNVNDVATQVPGTGVLSAPATVAGSTSTWDFAGELYVRTDTAARIRSRAAVAAGRTGIITRGWRDFRGKDAP